MKVIGYWEEGRNSEWPHPRYFVGDWPGNDKNKILAYMHAGTEGDSYKGWSECRMCGKTNGSSDVHDGEWLWPIGLTHYAEAHSVVLPQEFINHVRANNYIIPDRKPIRAMPFEDCSDKEDLSFWRAYTREATAMTLAESQEKPAPQPDWDEILKDVLSKRDL